MKISRTPILTLAATAALCVAGAAQATITFVTTAAAFTGSATDTFSDLAINSDLQTLSLSRTAGSFRYTLSSTANSADYSGLFTVPVGGSGGISTGWYNDALGFNLQTTPVLAFGGNFFGTNNLGELATGGLTLTVTDIAGLSLTRTITGGSATAFSGFLSDVALRSVSVSMTAPSTSVWASVDNVVLSAVPEPGTWALMLAGMGVLACSRRRS